MFSAAFATFFATACATQTSPNYTVTMPADASMNGMRAYINDYDTGEAIDSTVVADGTVAFKGNIEKPALARIIVGGNRGAIFILEPGDITIDADTRAAKGSPLNQRLEDYSQEQQKLYAEFQSLTDDSLGRVQADEIRNRAAGLTQKLIDENADNPIGLLLLLQNIYDNDLTSLEALLAKYPALASSSRVAKYKEALRNKAETQPGNKFKDFAITYNGETKKLSDYVGKGKYTLVDFWASWCGPCIRETKVLKKLYEKYNDKGLDFLGVAVWDEPANTEAAIKQHQLPWTNIINAQTIPTDLYGISGIPCIILFAPDGTIVSRDKQDDELIQAVESVMETTPTTAE